MDKTLLTELSEQERDEALGRYKIIQPFLEGQMTLKAAAQAHNICYRTAGRWVSRYRRSGLAGLIRAQRRDRNQRKLEPELQQIIEGLTLQKTKPSAAAIHRQVEEIAQQQGWSVPSYSVVYDVVCSLDPALVKLAREGTKAYQQSYDLLYRRETHRPNEIWQADHTLLDIWLLDEKGQKAKPWLTVVEDDYSRCIAGYFLSFKHPNTQHTSLALHQAIWRKSEPNWRICGIPQVFYTDNGSDFTSRHMEQVSADLKMRLVFSIPGMPRGRGRVERFFQTVNQLFLHKLPGYAPEREPIKKPKLTLVDFDAHFKDFLLNEYNLRVQKDMDSAPQFRWEADSFLPQMPESLEQLDLLLLTVATTRRVHRDGIYFQRLRYMDLALAAYIGEDVVIRYDPRDMAEIRIYHRNAFLCRAVCQELADKIISLEEIIRARNRRRRALRGTIKERSALIQAYLEVHEDPPPVTETENDQELPEPTTKRLKRYYNE
jgi:putative transposase